MSSIRVTSAATSGKDPLLSASPAVTEVSFEAAYASVAAELQELMPSGSAVVDVHTHLGTDEDGQSLGLEGLIGYLDQVALEARACVPAS